MNETDMFGARSSFQSTSSDLDFCLPLLVQPAILPSPQMYKETHEPRHSSFATFLNWMSLLFVSRSSHLGRFRASLWISLNQPLAENRRSPAS